MANEIIYEGDANVDMFRLGNFSDGVWVAIINLAFPTNKEIKLQENQMVKITIEKTEVSKEVKK